MGWQKWAVLAGGAALAPFTGGASLAVAAPVAGALDQKEKIDKAKKEQAAAALKAESALGGGMAGAGAPGAGTGGAGGVTAGITNAAQGLTTAAQQLNPYLQLGGQSANGLSTLMGFGGTSPLPAPTAAPTAPTGAVTSNSPVSGPNVPTSTVGEPGGHQTLASLVTDDNASRDMPPSLARAVAARAQNASSYSQPNVQGPDGQYYRVPEDQIEAALAAGGTRLQMGRA